MHPIARLLLLLAVAALVFWLVTRLRESTRGDKVSFRPVEDLPADVQQSIDHALAQRQEGHRDQALPQGHEGPARRGQGGDRRAGVEARMTRLPLTGRLGTFTWRMLATVLIGQSLVILLGALLAREHGPRRG